MCWTFRIKRYGLAVVLPLLFLYGCKNNIEVSSPNDVEVEIEDDEYEKFKVKPKYITNPTSDQKDYFESYNKTMEQWEVAYEELYVPTTKGTAHVILSGPKNGIPVILLHGMNSSSTMWYPNAKSLAQEYRIFAIDMIFEAGKSNLTADFEGLDESAEWYQEIFTALELDSYHLIGASRGGWLATNLALHDKGSVRSVVLLGPAQTFGWIPPSTDLLKNILNIFHSEEKSINRTMETMSEDTSKIDPNYMEQYHIAKNTDSLNQYVAAMKPFSKKELESLKMPVLVLIGDDDMFNTERSIQLAEKHIPQAKGEIIPDSGHFISVDQAGIVNQKILSFLKSVDQ